MAQNIGADDKERVTKLCRETMEWIDDHPNADQEEYEAKKRTLEEQWKPIISAAYGQQQQQQQGSNQPGPKIDELD